MTTEQGLILIFVSSITVAFVWAMLGLRFGRLARRRRALEEGRVARADARDRPPPALVAIGLTEAFRVGDEVGGRGVVDGVEVEGILEQRASATDVERFALTVRVTGLRVTALTRYGPQVEGPPRDVATRFDVDARRALDAAFDGGWEAHGDRLVRTAIRTGALPDALRGGVEAARRLLPGQAERRLVRTATADPDIKMRRLALATLLASHPSADETRRAVEANAREADQILRWLALRPTTPHDAWLRMTGNLLLDPTRAREVADVLVCLEATEALPALGQAIVHHRDKAITAALARARSELATRGPAEAGALALTEPATGGLALDE